MDDWQLLNDYATRNSEEAFRALVERYAGMVYHTALRQLGNPHSAEEVAQVVFIILAQKAAKIRRQPTLYGWLFRATRFAVLNQRRQEKNRARRELEAYAMQSASNPDDLNPVWKQITPHLDDALHKLPATDRELVMIRYFGNKSHKEAAQTLGVSEDVARKRLSRAMEKLRVIFARRGVAVTSLALVAAFTAHGVQAAPLGLTASLAGVAVVKGAAASASTLTLIKGALKIMAWTKTKTAIVAGLGMLLAAGTATITVKEIQKYRNPTHIAEMAEFATPRQYGLQVGSALLGWSVHRNSPSERSGYIYLRDMDPKGGNKPLWEFALTTKRRLSDVTRDDLRCEFYGMDDPRGPEVFGDAWTDGAAILVPEGQIFFARLIEDRSVIYVIRLAKQGNSKSGHAAMRIEYREFTGQSL